MYSNNYCEVLCHYCTLYIVHYVCCVQNEGQSDSVRLLCLLSIGEIGRKK